MSNDFLPNMTHTTHLAGKVAIIFLVSSAGDGVNGVILPVQAKGI